MILNGLGFLDSNVALLFDATKSNIEFQVGNVKSIPLIKSTKINLKLAFRQLHKYCKVRLEFL